MFVVKIKTYSDKGQMIRIAWTLCLYAQLFQIEQKLKRFAASLDMVIDEREVHISLIFWMWLLTMALNLLGLYLINKRIRAVGK